MSEVLGQRQEQEQEQFCEWVQEQYDEWVQEQRQKQYYDWVQEQRLKQEQEHRQEQYCKRVQEQWREQMQELMQEQMQEEEQEFSKWEEQEFGKFVREYCKRSQKKKQEQVQEQAQEQEQEQKQEQGCVLQEYYSGIAMDTQETGAYSYTYTAETANEWFRLLLLDENTKIQEVKHEESGMYLLSLEYAPIFDYVLHADGTPWGKSIDVLKQLFIVVDSGIYPLFDGSAFGGVYNTTVEIPAEDALLIYSQGFFANLTNVPAELKEESNN